MAPLVILATTTTLLKSALPNTQFLLATAAAASSTTTALQQQQQSNNNDNNKNNSITSITKNMISSSPPRVRACTYMASAMALHFGGYEFARSGALALFTSSDTGLVHPSAYPLAMGLVTPVSLILLYWYGLMVKNKSGGPRQALRRTTLLAISMLTMSIVLLQLSTNGSMIQKGIVALLFIFQNSYAHLLYSQQWSFLGSVMTPTEGAKWFSSIAGLSSLVCTITATCVPTLASTVGLKGLILGTSLTLTLSMPLADRAYALGEKYGFDPTPELQRKETEKGQNKEQQQEDTNLITKTVSLFQRVPTLAALFGEVIAFQSLSTILNLCFVRTLKQSMPSDTNRASYTGKFYAYANGMSALMQFCVLPLARKYLEPKWSYVAMPLLLLPWLAYTAYTTTSLWMVSAAFFSLKTLDYSLRNVVNEMVYQPLDFESRYVGKEVIGVFANRFGKSGMSLLLSLWTVATVTQLSHCSVAVGALWSCCSFWLSRNVVSNEEAEERVAEERNNNNNKSKRT